MREESKILQSKKSDPFTTKLVSVREWIQIFLDLKAFCTVTGLQDSLKQQLRKIKHNIQKK